MLKRTRSHSAVRRVGALINAAHLPSWLRGRPRPQPAEAAVPVAEHGGGSQDQPASRWDGAGATIASYRNLVLATIAFALLALLALHPHMDLLESAFGGPVTSPSGGGQDATDATNLFNVASTLTSDAQYVLVPCVSLAGAVGAIAWALGHRRGPGIVGGAVVAGVVGVGLSVIVS